MFYFLEVEIEPFAASLISETIATTFYLAVVFNRPQSDKEPTS